ncbi:hypothetical protein SmJEL517_g03109 [Synchytrium microbalum]|uniref:Histidine kinase/HSP90-like ATPase domain-containing protein n=1 Tax=Synchytrium microbalum TaxID=1806994 RepID=A0A507C885_9FUNG|nr:uncharacterized protein SmJEL517_g03109 [Synchytrium microbalum]TPX34206.1 hypothetical protein SmJEL517_g03109 [Synchytrium microbalum]
MARSVRKTVILLLIAIFLFASVCRASTADDNAASMPDPDKILSESQEAEALKNGEKFVFETEVNRLMHLLIHSLYKAKEIFLRELISNGSDALDKIRFLSLTEKNSLASNPDLKITIVADKDRGTLTITDTGVGMTKKDLRENLGTIAKSGTSEFLSALESNATADVSLIGQFGVGFYSAFLVADRVTVVSKHNSDKQYIWESTSQSDFTITEDPRGDTLGRGTQIILHLKAEAMEYLDQTKLKDLVKKYSLYINFPIYVWTSRTERVEVPLTDDEIAEKREELIKKKEEEKASKDDTEEVGDDSESSSSDAEVSDDDIPKTKPVEKTLFDWEMANGNKPIWTRNPSDITDEEYNEFYKAFSKDTEDPQAWNHFKAEGEVEFRAILYIPKKAPPKFLQSADEIIRNIKLFVKRVFITDELVDFLPRYLSFLKGLVDSDDIPLNVSREQLQHSTALKVIKKKLIGKAMEMFRKLSKNDEKYNEFFKQFGTAIKLGAIEDQTHKKRLTKLLRFSSSASDDLTSLDGYIKRMKKGQQQIYFVTGISLDEIKRSPLIEKPITRGYEILYFHEPIDEYLAQGLFEYEGKKLQNVAKAGLKYGDEDDVDKDKESDQTATFEPLTKWLVGALEEFIEKVVVSNKLTKSPTAIVATEYGMSGTMEKIMAAQAFQSGDDFMKDFYSKQKKILEINPTHPIITSLLAKVEKIDSMSPDEVSHLIETVHVLYETTLLRSGWDLKNSNDFAARVERVIRTNLGVSLEATANVDVKAAPEVEAETDAASSSTKDEEGDDDSVPNAKMIPPALEDDEILHEEL